LVLAVLNVRTHGIIAGRKAFDEMAANKTSGVELGSVVVTGGAANEIVPATQISDNLIVNRL
jgi:hypothetical protein